MIFSITVNRNVKINKIRGCIICNVLGPNVMIRAGEQLNLKYFGRMPEKGMRPIVF